MLTVTLIIIKSVRFGKSFHINDRTWDNWNFSHLESSTHIVVLIHSLFNNFSFCDIQNLDIPQLYTILQLHSFFLIAKCFRQKHALNAYEQYIHSLVDSELLWTDNQYFVSKNNKITNSVKKNMLFRLFLIS